MTQQRASISMVQNCLLIWLDEDMDAENDVCRNMIKQLRCVVNAVNTFTDVEQCVTFLLENNDEKACMIVSGALGQQIVPQVHDMPQVDSIFIFYSDKKHHKQWTKEWTKIKVVFTEITTISEALKKAARECEQNAIGISFMPTSDAAASSTNTNELDCPFVYTQILKEILLTIDFQEQHIKDFVDYYREVFAENTDELSNIQQLERKYRDKTPIWWYTYECFLYPMLNRALRIMDMNIIIKMGFFICDLHRHIQKLHSEQFGDHHEGQVFTVYRGQGLSKIDFEQMVNTKGGIISFNSFMSTSKARTVSLDYARRVITNPDLVGILFVMTIDPSISSAPFASINDVSYVEKQEDEVLFSLHSVFRIEGFKQIDGNNRLWQVELTLTGDNDQQLQALTESIRQETREWSGWDRLGQLLLKIGHPNRAQELYELLLQQSSTESDKANILHQLGYAVDEQGKHDQALSFYENSLEIEQKILPSNYLNLAWSYNDIGLVYDEMGEYSQALSSHEKAVELRQKVLSPNHPDLAMSYNNIGSVYFNMGEYSKACLFYQRAVDIGQTSLPSTHSDLQNWRNDLKNVKKKM